MHTQTDSTHGHRANLAPTSHAAIGLGLYLLTLSGEAMLGASIRWLLFYLGAATVGAIVPLGLSAEAVAYVAAFAPLAWSVLGLVQPGSGWVWRRRLGARRPSAEEAMALGDAFEILRSAAPARQEPRGCYVLDDPLPTGAVRGTTVILSRGLIESDSLTAVLAHELGHVRSLDGRITEALNRLALWDDPLALPQAGSGGGGQAELDPETGGGLIWALLRLTLRLSGGAFVQRLLSPLWAAHWRAGEYAADAHAASLGQGEDLVRHLTDQELAFDAPQPGLLFNRAQHPPVALRIERLQQRFEAEGVSK